MDYPSVCSPPPPAQSVNTPDINISFTIPPLIAGWLVNNENKVTQFYNRVIFDTITGDYNHRDYLKGLCAVCGAYDDQLFHAALEVIDAVCSLVAVGVATGKKNFVINRSWVHGDKEHATITINLSRC